MSSTERTRVRWPLHRASRRESRSTRFARLRESASAGLWFVPALCFVLAITGAAATIAVDRRVDSAGVWLVYSGGPTSAQQILTTIATSMLTFTGLVFSITIVALQLASSQFSPRVLRSFLRDRGSQFALGTFIATFVYALGVLVATRTGAAGGEVFVPRVSVTLAVALVVASLGVFVYYVNHVAQSIRLVNIVDAVAQETREAIAELYPAEERGGPGTAVPELGEPRQRVLMTGPGGVVTSYNAARLVEVAEAGDCVVRMVPDVGDFVVEGDVLVEVHGGRSDLPPAEVRGALDIGPERSVRLDPAFGIRQLVDIAERALSPSLNDPTTAVQALDRIHDLLNLLARRPHPSGVYQDPGGNLRLVRRHTTWNGFVVLAFEEIREYGGGSVQVQRRLRAALEDLIAAAPTDRQEPLQRQLRLLRRSAARHFVDEEEREVAQEADDAGLGSDDEPADGQASA